MTPALTLQLGAGASLWGDLVVNDKKAPGGVVRTLIAPGWLASVSGSYRVVDGAGTRPFVLLTGTLAGSGARTKQAPAAAADGALLAFDIRVGATIGKTLWNLLSPYAAARVFGGPILWRTGDETRAGTDQYHFQIAAGAVVELPAAMDVFAEIAPFGERAVVVGGGFSF
jgi:hypothetical protein